MRCSASTPVSPACWLCILPSRPLSAFGLDDRAKVSACTSGADPRSTGPTTLSSPMGVPASAPGALRSRCRSAELRVKRTHNSALYGRRRPAGTAVCTALPRWFADTEEDGGSTPPAPTTQIEQHFCMPARPPVDVIGGRKGWSAGRAFNCLTEAFCLWRRQARQSSLGGLLPARTSIQAPSCPSGPGRMGRANEPVRIGSAQQLGSRTTPAARHSSAWAAASWASWRHHLRARLAEGAGMADPEVCDHPPARSPSTAAS
jgi:hypothetical protein